MKRVICSRPNASDMISGVKFDLLEDGRRISVEIDDETAQMFLDVDGYDEDLPPVPPVPPTPPVVTPPAPKAPSKAKEVPPTPIVDEGEVF